MGYAQDTGYVPSTIAEIVASFRENINTNFQTNYVAENFVGSNHYKVFYSIAQDLQKLEIKTSEIFLLMQNYFRITNEKIQRPNTTHPGIYDFFKSRGYFVSTKPPLDADAGKLFICVDVDHEAPGYAAKKLEICNLVKLCCIGGVVSQGTEEEEIALDNGQSFPFKYNLPTKIPVELRLTVTQSDNNLFTISPPDVVAQLLFDKINASYRLGKNFEPQRYFSVVDAPWASEVLLEWSDDAGENWSSEIYEAEYDEVFTFELEDIDVIEA